MKEIGDIQKKYQGRNVNMLMPITNETQINPFYKFTVMEVLADTSENTGDIFKVGSTKVTGQGGKDVYVDVFSPAKPLLMKLAAAAGIQFDPNNTYGEYLSRNIYKAKAYGAMRLPDGTGKTHVDEKVINLEDEEDRFRLEFLDKSIQGIMEPKPAEEAAKLFKGEWVDATNRWGKPCKAYKIADIDRQKYIERAVLVNMTLLRKTFAEKAMTGAILRVIRALIGMKGTYTMEELQKPFVIPRVTFNPDYNNPEVRREMLAQGMASVHNMFGTSGNPLPTPDYVDMPLQREVFDAEEFADNVAFASDAPGGMSEEEELFGTPKNAEQGTQGWEQDDPFPEPSSEGQALGCSQCGASISGKVMEYSSRKYGRALCMGCQKAAGD